MPPAARRGIATAIIEYGLRLVGILVDLGYVTSSRWVFRSRSRS
jgi:hypothetical protein